MTMGQRTIIDKTVHPLTTITSITPAGVISDVARAGVIPIGNYKGVPAFWDLDKANNQPLVNAELAHILGILNGREEGYDLVTLTAVIGAPIGTVQSGTLVVPAGQVWYINAVRTILNTAGGAQGLVGNWRCSLWVDRAVTPSPAGQSFHPAAGLIRAPGGATPWLDEFGPIATAWLITNKVPLLRLPAGAIITFAYVTTDAIVNAAVASTLALFGAVGKQLVA